VEKPDTHTQEDLGGFPAPQLEFLGPNSSRSGKNKTALVWPGVSSIPLR